MTIISAVPGSGDAFAKLVQGLQMEFGCVDVGAIAARILETEAADFHWDARVKERYLGRHYDVDLCDDGLIEELDRIAIVTILCGRWHAGVCLVDGEGRAQDLLWLRSFDQREEAFEAFACMR